MKTTKIVLETPTVHLAINKGRIKQYKTNSEVPVYYLNKGQEFQIELYNPTSNRVLAQIKLNNKYISPGLILRPGERVFLDRYLDENRKFLFDTYNVKKSKKNKKAIEDNGDLVVEFYDEYVHTSTQSWGTTGNWDYRTLTTTDSGTNITLTGNIGTTTSCFSNSTPICTTTGNMDLNYNMANMTQDIFIPNRSETKVKKEKSVETGRVEKGSASKQKLEEASGNFNSWVSTIISLKLLPTSLKNMTTEDVRRKYCTDCGGKVKDSHKFCANCGNKQ